VSPWNYARTWTAIASAAPEREAIVTDAGQRITYAGLRDRAERLAGVFAGAGIGAGDAVGIALCNRPEYFEVFWAALLVGAAPANVNYQYGAAELAHVLSDCDAAAFVFGTEMGAAIAGARDRATCWSPRLLLGVGEGEVPGGSFAYEDVFTPGALPVATPEHVPSPDDTLLLYTGGTTGMPKGVVWRVEDYFLMGWEIGRPGTTPSDPEHAMRAGKRAATLLPASPLVHGTALGLATQTLSGGGTVVLRADPRLDPAGLLDLVEREHVAVLGIVGDTFARPIVEELERTGAHRDLRELHAIVSSGMRFSAENKTRLVELVPGVTVVDSLGSSEGMMTRSTVSARDNSDGTSFAAGERVRVITDDGRDAVPGSDDEGLLMVTGHLPLRYHNDPEKTAETFRIIDGARFAAPGDRARVRADGRIELLGRGSACINTGGEKVYPQEVEDVLRRHERVADAAVLGIPDERWGEMVVAIVEPATNGDGAGAGNAADALSAELATMCRDHLAGYKRPKRYFVVDELPHTVAGKPDTVRLREHALAS
jgi:3-oxocholest-4-en-26-oate---CoA ligase